MQKQSYAVDVRIGIKMIDPRSVECTRAPDDPVDLVAFPEQKIGEIASVLSSDPCDERFLHEQFSPLKQRTCVSNLFQLPQSGDHTARFICFNRSCDVKNPETHGVSPDDADMADLVHGSFRDGAM